MDSRVEQGRSPWLSVTILKPQFSAPPFKTVIQQGPSVPTFEELLGQYSAPTHLRMDNGPEFIAHALQEWCTGNGSGTEYIPPRFSMGESICGVIQRQAER